MKIQLWYKYLIGAVIFLPVLGSSDPTLEKSNCTTTREYVTTLEFLWAKKDFAIQDQEAQKLAKKVATGCTGAAQRFIGVTLLLSQSGMNGKDAAMSGLDFSVKSDRETETFIAVFKRAYLSEYLDLDLRSSIQMARSLSTEFDGNTLAVRDDFEKLIEFCVTTKHLDLPRPQCGTFAARVAKKGQPWNGGVYKAFVSTFEFIRSDSGPALTTGQALKIAEDLIANGPTSPDNFIQAYRYATSRKGLAMSTRDALDFANQMAVAAPQPASEKK